MSEPFIGQIQPFAFSYAPDGWITCQGQLLQVSQYQAVFALLGTTYGGNGAQNFAVPNLKGRSMIGVGQSASGTTYQRGQVGGSETTTLSVANMPAHNHSGAGLSVALSASSSAATASSPAAGMSLGAASGEVDPTTDPVTVKIYAPAGGTPVTLNGGSIAGATGITGNSTPFTNMSPFMALNICMALQGLWPPQP